MRPSRELARRNVARAGWMIERRSSSVPPGGGELGSTCHDRPGSSTPPGAILTRVRADGSHIRLDDAERWSPPWSVSGSRPDRRAPGAACEGRPGNRANRLLTPSDDGDESIDTEVEWVSEDGQPPEAALWRRQHGAMGCVPGGCGAGRWSGTVADRAGQRHRSGDDRPGSARLRWSRARCCSTRTPHRARRSGGPNSHVRLKRSAGGRASGLPRCARPAAMSWAAAPQRRQWRVPWVGRYGRRSRGGLCRPWDRL